MISGCSPGDAHIPGSVGNIFQVVMPVVQQRSTIRILSQEKFQMLGKESSRCWVVHIHLLFWPTRSGVRAALANHCPQFVVTRNPVSGTSSLVRQSICSSR